MVHAIIIVIRCIRAAGTVRNIRAVGGGLLIGVGRALLIAVIIGVIRVVLWTAILLSPIVGTAKDLVWQSDILHARRVVRRLRLRIGREPLALVGREGVRGEAR